MKHLGELWQEALQYGRITIYTMESGKNFVTIAFNTIHHVKLEAQSPIVDTPEEAMTLAIKKAQEIIDSMVDLKHRQQQKLLGVDKTVTTA